MLAIRSFSLSTHRPPLARLTLRPLSCARSQLLARHVQPGIDHTRKFATSPISTQANTTTPSTDMTTFYDLKAELPGGKTLDFAQYKGKVVLIVNTASKWCVHRRLSSRLQ